MGGEKGEDLRIEEKDERRALSRKMGRNREERGEKGEGRKIEEERRRE